MAFPLGPGSWAIQNVWSAAVLQARNENDRLVSANVFVNKGEGVVKDKDILFAA